MTLCSAKKKISGDIQSSQTCDQGQAPMVVGEERYGFVILNSGAGGLDLHIDKETNILKRIFPSKYSILWQVKISSCLKIEDILWTFEHVMNK